MAAHSPQSNPSPPPTSPTAVVKGAGPAGLATAISLAQAGFFAHVVERRPHRPTGQGRKNVVAIRPEGLRQLESLGGLDYILQSKVGRGNVGCITRMTDAKSWSELDGFELPWILKRYPPAEPDEYRVNGESDGYEVPGSVTEQFPSSYICLGDLEDCLAQAAVGLGIKITYDATFTLTQSKDDSDEFSLILLDGTGRIENLGSPDLIVCASGKNDSTVPSQLSFEQRKGVLLTESNLPNLDDSSNPFALRFCEGADSELETQRMCVFGVSDPTLKQGFLAHAMRKYPPSDPTPATSSTTESNGILSQSQGQPQPEPLVEIQMNHASAAHLILQPPRSLPSSELEPYLVHRVNTIVQPTTPYKSINALRLSGNLLWGDPLSTVTVETATAPQYVFGRNVILVGDCAMSCSPSSGIGAEIGITVDSKAVRILGEKWRDARGDKDKERQALLEFNLAKAKSAVMWSQASRMFYSTTKESEEWITRQAAATAA